MRLILTIAFLLMLGMGTLSAQEFPKQDASPMDMAYYPPRVAFRAFAKTEAEKNAEPVIRVVYSRPQKKGREIFGDLVKYGEMWRVGANESTEITFMEKVTINGQKIKPGRYTVYANPSEDSWEIFFNKDLDGWGHYAYDPAQNVASITVPTQQTSETVEAMAIMFEDADNGANMLIGWDDTMVSVPIEFKK